MSINEYTISFDTSCNEYDITVTGDSTEFQILMSASGTDELDIDISADVYPYPAGESDPIFTAHAAYAITTGDIAEWNGATGQMATHLIAHNHALLHAAYSDAETPSTIGTMLGTQSAATPASGDVFPFVQTVGNTLKKITLANLITQLQAVEADPIFTASPARAIVTGDIMNWNAAYGWGDHEGLYDATGGISGHLTAFNHALIHAPGSDDQDLSGYSTTGHTHTGFETSGNMSQHLTDYDHAAFITSADLANDYEASGAVAAHLIAFNHNLTGLYETSGGLASHLLAFNHGLIQVYETSGEMSGHLTDYDHAAFLTSDDLVNDYEASGALSSHLLAYNHGLIQVYETTGEVAGHLISFNHGLLHASGSDNQDLSAYSTTGHNHDSTYLAITSKAASGEINTGTDDAKFITSKGLSESYYTYSAEITIIKKLTAAEYAALTPKSDTTLYIIVG